MAKEGNRGSILAYQADLRLVCIGVQVNLRSLEVGEMIARGMFAMDEI